MNAKYPWFKFSNSFIVHISYDNDTKNVQMVISVIWKYANNKNNYWYSKDTPEDYIIHEEFENRYLLYLFKFLIIQEFSDRFNKDIIVR